MRQVMEEIVDEIAHENRDAIKDSLREAFTRTLKKTYKRQITCKECGQARMYPIEIEVPDLKGQMIAWQVALDQSKGKPKETVKVQVDVGVRQWTEMTLAELDAAEQAILTAHPELAEQN